MARGELVVGLGKSGEETNANQGSSSADGSVTSRSVSSTSSTLSALPWSSTQRATNALSISCEFPVEELRSWVDHIGGDLLAAVESMAASLVQHVEDYVKTRLVHVSPLQVKRDREHKRLLTCLCRWFEHLIFAAKLLQELPPGSRWEKTAQFCRDYLREIVSREPQRVCSKAFTAGDIVWNCKQCQMDSTCVLCQDCFRESDHEGHDVYFYHVMTDSGGCCDCGDPGAWDPKGFCKRHGEQNVPDPEGWLPAMVEECTRVVLRHVVAFLVRLMDVRRPELLIRPVIGRFVEHEGPLETATSILREVDILRHTLHRIRPRDRSNSSTTTNLLREWLNKVWTAVSRIATCDMDVDSKREKLVDEIEPLIVTTVSLENIIQCRKAIDDFGERSEFFSLQLNAIETVLQSLATEHIATWLLETLCQNSDSFSRLAARALTREDSAVQPLESMILSDLKLPDPCSKFLRGLHIRLLVDSVFKEKFSVAFAKTYRRCCEYRTSRVPIFDSLDTDTIFGLSVQFLNRAQHVYSLVKDHGFLLSILESLRDTIARCKIADSDQIDLFHPILVHRKTKCLVTDLTYICNTPGMSLHFIAGNRHSLTAWLDVQKMLFRLHPQERIIPPNDPVHDDRWIPAFNLALSILALYPEILRYFIFGASGVPAMTEKESFAAVSLGNFSANERSSLPGKPHAQICCQVMEFCAEHLVHLFEKMAPAATSFVSHRNLMGDFRVMATDGFVSFHCIPERYFAMQFQFAVASSLEAEDFRGLLGHGSESFWLALLRNPVTALVTDAEVGSGAWIRNEDMASQAMNYCTLPYFSGMLMDVKVVQSALLGLSGDLVVNFLLNTFGITDFLRLGVEPIALFVESEDLDEKEFERRGRMFLLDSCIELISIIATEMGSPTVRAFEKSKREPDAFTCLSKRILRREIVHVLAVKPTAFSLLNDACGHLRQVGIHASMSSLMNVLDEIAEKQASTGLEMGPSKYELKPDAWHEFDPLFHRLSGMDKSDARDRWLAMRKSEEEDKACFPGDTRRKSDPPRKHPLPAAPSFRNDDVHPVFKVARWNLLCCDAIFWVLQRSLEKIDDPSNEQGLLLPNVLHLLTLVIHNCSSSSSGLQDSAVLETFWSSLRTSPRSQAHDRYLWILHQNQNQEHTTTASYASQDFLVATTAEKFLWRPSSEERSILELLLRIWEGPNGSDVAVRESLRWILAEINNLHKNCHNFIKERYRAHKTAKQQESKAQPEDKVVSRKRKAQRAANAKKNAMNAMKAIQDEAARVFLTEGLTGARSADEHDNEEMVGNEGDGQDTKMASLKEDVDFAREAKTRRRAGDANENLLAWEGPECVSCHEKHCLGEDLTFYIGFRQENDTHVLDEYDVSSSGYFAYWPTTASLALERRERANKSDFRSLIQLCGHAIHGKCLERYEGSVRHSHSLANDLKRNEFLCPLCKKLSNFRVPCLPDAFFQVDETPSFSKFSLMEAGGEFISGALFPAEVAHKNADINVSFHWTLTHQDPRSIYLAFSRSVISVCSSRREGFSLSRKPYLELLRLYRACRGKFLFEMKDLEHDKDKTLPKTIQRMLNSAEGSHAVLRQSPELILILSSIVFSTPREFRALTFGCVALKWCQALLEAPQPSATETLEKSDSQGSFAGASEMRETLVSLFLSRNQVSIPFDEKPLCCFMFEFFKVFSLMQHLLRGFTNDETYDVEFGFGIADLGGLWQTEALPSPHDIVRSEGMLRTFHKWIVQCKDLHRGWVPRALRVSSGRFPGPHLRPLAVRPLIELRQSYTEQYAEIFAKLPSAGASSAERDRAICLICGSVMFSGSDSTLRSQSRHSRETGNCTRHVSQMHHGNGAILLFRRSSTVLLIHNSLSAFWSSLYVDKNGDDQQVVPSLPMSLDLSRWEKLQRLWAESRIPEEVSSLRNRTQILIRGSYY